MDAHTAHDGLLPHPLYGTLKVYELAEPPAFTYLQYFGQLIQILCKQRLISVMFYQERKGLCKII